VTPSLRGPLRISDPAMIDRICRFRVEIWRRTGLVADWAFPDGTWRDALDDVAEHYAYFDGDALVCSTRVSMFATMDEMPDADHYRALGLQLRGPILMPERLVVAPEWRRTGLPAQIGDFCLRRARELGANLILTEASPRTVPFLLRRGRRHLGPGPFDPRFPEVRFELILTEAHAFR